MHDLTIGSLFTGIGLLDIAVERVTGGNVLWQCEIDVWRRAVLRKWWPDAERYGDVTRLFYPERVDILCGGFPCQDVSTAGRRVGISGARSGLWREYARIIGEIDPHIVFIENVPGLERRGLDQVLKSLDALGYSSRRGRLAACDVGAPHRRERLFILAYADEGRVWELAERVEQLASKREDAFDLDDRATRSVAPDWPPGLGADRWGAWLEDHPGCEPGIYRVAHGRANGMEQLRRARVAALGDAVCPQQAEIALRGLINYKAECLTEQIELW